LRNFLLQKEKWSAKICIPEKSHHRVFSLESNVVKNFGMLLKCVTQVPEKGCENVFSLKRFPCPRKMNLLGEKTLEIVGSRVILHYPCAPSVRLVRSSHRTDSIYEHPTPYRHETN
jgi:hypothetical protein